MAAVKELCVQIADKPGALGVVSEALGRVGINIDGFGVWDGCARLLVDDIDPALKILREEGFGCRTQQVLRLDLPDEPGGHQHRLCLLGHAASRRCFHFRDRRDRSPRRRKGPRVPAGVMSRF